MMTKYPKEIEVFKLVAIKGGRYLSSWCTRVAPRMAIEYSIGQMSRGIEGTPLMAFERLEYADEWYHSMLEIHNSVILRCRAKKSACNRTAPLKIYAYNDLKSKVIQFWNDQEDSWHCLAREYVQQPDFPPGTILCDYIVPIEVVAQKEVLP